MANISVATYRISVHKRFSKTPERLDHFEGADLFEFVEEFLSDRKSPLNLTDQKHLVRASIHSKQGREICGIIETGEYGYSSELFDTSKEKVSYKRKTTDAEMLPFFYLFDLPRNEHHGILILQRFKSFGIRRLFASELTKFFSTRFSHSTIEIEPIVHPKLLSELQKSTETSKIRFRQLRIPKDICEAFGGRLRPEDGYVEYSIIAKKKTSFAGNIKTFLGSSAGGLLALPGGFKPERTLLEVNLNGRRRTLDIADITKLRTYFDITNEVKMGANGHPTITSLHEISRGLAKDLWVVMKGAANVQQS